MHATSTDAPSFEPDRATLVAGTLAVALAAFFARTFAAGALPELVDGGAVDPLHRRQLLVVLTLGGLAGSVLAAWRFRIERYPRQLSTAFRACAASAALTLSAQFAWAWTLVAVLLTGLSLGWLLVVLTSGLRSVVGATRLGLVIGTGVALAWAAGYAAWLFEVSARVQTITAAFAIATGSLTGPFMIPREPSVSTTFDDHPRGLPIWGAVFLAFGWLGAVLATVTGADAARPTQSGIMLAAVLVAITAALAVGRVLLANRWVSATFGVLAALVLAGIFAARAEGAGSAMVLQSAGLAGAATMVGVFVARNGRARVAGGMFVAAGWLATAFGTVMAEEQVGTPVTFALVAVVVVLAALAFRRHLQRGSPA